jgi:hypothetical protein
MATHGKARERTIAALQNRKPFHRSGFAMRAIEGKTSLSGRLPVGELIAYRKSEIAYTVISYQTPIAWVTTDGEVYVSQESYSVTTSHHQGLCRVYL